VIQAGRYAAEVHAVGDVDVMLRALLVDLRSRAPVGPIGRIDIDEQPSGGLLIRADRRVWGHDISPADAADQVVRMVLRAALDAESEFVHIHAGAVSLDDRTVVVCGVPGAGKSTAIAALLREGFEYLTDERLVVAHDGRSVAGFPKPISLVRGSFAVLAHLDPVRTGRGCSNANVWQIPASSVAALAPPGFRQADLLVFVSFRKGSPMKVTHVAPADAAWRLLGDSPDLIRRSRAGARSIVSLTQTDPAVEVRYGELDQLGRTVRGLLERRPAVAAEPLIELSGAAATGVPAPASPTDVDTALTYAITAGTSVWIMGGRALCYLDGTGQIVELDEVDAAWMQLLEPSRSVDALLDEIEGPLDNRASIGRATARRSLHSMWTAGVVGPASRN
jgi:hypothetical protein